MAARVPCQSLTTGYSGACLVRGEIRQEGREREREREENEMVRWQLLDGGFKKISNLQIGPKPNF